MNLNYRALERQIAGFFEEDDLNRNLNYISSLPDDLVTGKIFIKSDLILSGLPWFVSSLRYLSSHELTLNEVLSHEGKCFKGGDALDLGEIPFGIALTGERIALNLLQRASSISTFTSYFVEKAKKYNIAVLDTRKTTPGLRSLEKYAVVKGGGFNHRYGQADAFMIKDNHKSFFGSVKKAVEFFKGQHGFYTPFILEVHNLDELKVAMEMKVRHIMLDNFFPGQIEEALKLKTEGVTFELSGGITQDNFDQYLIEGVDAISMGCLTYGAPQVDISFKYEKI